MFSRLVTERRLTPRRNGSGTAYGRLALAAAVRVIARVHDGTADGGTYAHVTGFTRFAYADDFVFQIAHLTDGRLAGNEHVSHFAAGHFPVSYTHLRG